MWKRKTDKPISNIKTKKFRGKLYRYGTYRNYPVKNVDGKWRLIHQLNAKNKYKLEKIPKGFHIHHINPDKNDKNFNSYANLIIVHRFDHKNIHKLMRELKDEDG
jgi:hypothetical protein